MIPANLPGITIQEMDLVARQGKQFVYFDNVRVSREYLIGQENKGWWISQTTLELEHGGSGTAGGGRGRFGLIEKVIDYFKGA